jgi:glucose/arabinose dehydrogenase
MKKIYPPSCVCFLAAIIFLSTSSIKAQPILSFQTVTAGLENPVDIVTAPGDSRLFIAQQNGLVRTWNGTVLTDFLNLGSVITNPAGGEQGLLSIVFHPSYSSNRYFFVWYTSTTGAVTLARYERNAGNPDIADPGSGQVLLSIPKPGSPYFTNHNGAKLIFGNDGMLYIGTGDGGSAGDPFGNAQNVHSLLGKMLRIDVNGVTPTTPFYSIPPGNPYTAPGDGIPDEIYAIGLRNPWRWSFDRANGDLWIADVGQNLWEEVNWLPAGSTAGVNYGWNCYEGAHIYPDGGCTPTDTVSPIFEYPHDGTTGGFSITGGYVYRGPDEQNIPLRGYYITADYVSGNVWMIKPNGNGGWTSYRQAGLPGNISSFGEGADGTLYAVGRSAGAIYKIMLSSLVPVKITRFNAKALNGYNLLEWSSSSEVNIVAYHIEYSPDGRQFVRVGRLAAAGNSPGSHYDFQHSVPQSNGISFYRLAIEEKDGSLSFSEIISVRSPTGSIKIYPTILSNNISLTVDAPRPIKNLQLLNGTGVLVWQKNMQGQTGRIPVLLKPVPPGVYLLRIIGNDFVYKEKLIIR